MTMRKVDIMDAVKPLSEYAREIEGGDGPVVVMSDGRPVVALIPVEDEDDLEAIALNANQKFMEIVESSRRRHADEGGILHDEMRKRLGL